MTNGGDSKTVTGTVKWFDPQKGFGFIVTEEMEGVDILLHANVLRDFGQSSVADGSTIKGVVGLAERGWQMSSVLVIVPPTGPAIPLTDICGLSTAEIAKLPLLAARVKWFDLTKGYGFANVFGDRRDVFLHIEVLRHYGFATVNTGEAIAIKVTEAKRGKLAVQVCTWERALNNTPVSDERSAVAAK